MTSAGNAASFGQLKPYTARMPKPLKNGFRLVDCPKELKRPSSIHRADMMEGGEVDEARVFTIPNVTTCICLIIDALIPVTMNRR